MFRSLPTCTAILIGEGLAEYVFVSHVKSIFMPRGCGTTLKVQRGYGKGGRYVLDHAIQMKRDNEYNRCIAMLDTDTDWDEEQRERARLADIIVIECEPCLEAVLLAMHGVGGEKSTGEWKREFTRRFNGAAHEVDVYPRHFHRQALEAGRGRVAQLDQLLNVLNVGA